MTDHANPNCPFCSLSNDRIWLANDLAMAFKDGFPISEGHTLVVPRRHLGSIFDATPEETTAIWELVGLVRAKLVEELHPDAFNIGVNDGTAAGQTVMHGHIHVIPRYRGDVADPRGGIRWMFAGKAKYWRDKP